MKTSAEQDQLYAALAKARMDFTAASKTKTAKIMSDKATYSYRYAPLEEIFGAIDQALGANGLSLIGGSEYSDDGHLWVLTRLAHSSGQWVENGLDCGIPKGIKDAGSMLTYARRYGVCLTVQIQAEDDDDGERAGDDFGPEMRGGKEIKRPQTTKAARPEPHRNTDEEDPQLAPNGDSPRPEKQPLPKPTPEEVTQLLQRLRGTYSDPTVVDGKIREVLQIPSGQVWTDYRIRKEMTRAQYNTLQGDVQHYTTVAPKVPEGIDDVEDDDGDDDVQDFSGPEPTQDASYLTWPPSETHETSQPVESIEEQADAIDDHSAQSAFGEQRDEPATSDAPDVAATSGTITTAEKTSDATAEQIASLKRDAAKVGDWAAREVQDAIDHHPKGLPMNVYETMLRYLEKRNPAERKAGSKV